MSGHINLPTVTEKALALRPNRRDQRPSPLLTSGSHSPKLAFGGVFLRQVRPEVIA